MQASDLKPGVLILGPVLPELLTTGETLRRACSSRAASAVTMWRDDRPRHSDQQATDGDAHP